MFYLFREVHKEEDEEAKTNVIRKNRYIALLNRFL